MLNALLSVNADLGSSMALRYARELSHKMDMQLHGIHVIDPNRLANAPDSGWVRRTWENSLVETEKEEIRRFLEVEKADHPFIKIPRIVIGNRDDRLLDELRFEKYDLFMEGAPPTTNPKDFHKLIHSQLYRTLPCPALIVKNLLDPDKTAVLFDDHTDMASMASSVSGVFQNSRIALEPVYCRITKSGTLTVHEGSDKAGGLDRLHPDGVTVEGAPRSVEGAAQPMAEWLREYGLVVSSLKRIPAKNDPILDLLGRVSSPVLVLWK